MTVAVLLRSVVMGDYHATFCRAVEGADPFTDFNPDRHSSKGQLSKTRKGRKKKPK